MQTVHAKRVMHGYVRMQRGHLSSLNAQTSIFGYDVVSMQALRKDPIAGEATLQHLVVHKASQVRPCSTARSEWAQVYT